jgi:hypothetical protein
VASALATSFFAVLFGAGLAVTAGAGAVTVTAGVAGLASALGASAAKTVAVNIVAIKVAINFMIFPFWLM